MCVSRFFRVGGFPKEPRKMSDINSLRQMERTRGARSDLAFGAEDDRWDEIMDITGAYEPRFFRRLNNFDGLIRW